MSRTLTTTPATTPSTGTPSTGTPSADTLVRIHLLTTAPARGGDPDGDPLAGPDALAPLTSVVTSAHGDRLDVTLSGEVGGALGEELQLVLAYAREHCRRTGGTVFLDARRAQDPDGTLHRFLARLEGLVTAAGATLRDAG
ncbi:hypothetical protein NUM3379_05160 [Kineococcus sp. NUM-3379]